MSDTAPRSNGLADPSDFERSDWATFAAEGNLWFVNRILHVFGWSIIVAKDAETDEVVDAYPARTTWLGFSPETDERRHADFLKGLE